MMMGADSRMSVIDVSTRAERVRRRVARCGSMKSISIHRIDAFYAFERAREDDDEDWMAR